jgi:hypothetical protein
MLAALLRTDAWRRARPGRDRRLRAATAGDRAQDQRPGDEHDHDGEHGLVDLLSVVRLAGLDGAGHAELVQELGHGAVVAEHGHDGGTVRGGLDDQVVAQPGRGDLGLEAGQPGGGAGRGAVTAGFVLHLGKGSTAQAAPGPGTAVPAPQPGSAQTQADLIAMQSLLNSGSAAQQAALLAPPLKLAPGSGPVLPPGRSTS